MINKTIGSIGSGADYQSLYDFMTYCAGGVGDDVTGDIINSGATVGGGRFVAASAGYTIKVTCSHNAAEPNTENWYTVSAANASGTNYWRLTNANTNMIIEYVAFIISSGNTGPGNMVGVGGWTSGHAHAVTVQNCIFAGNASSEGLSISGLLTYSPSGTTTKVLSCKFQNLYSGLSILSGGTAVSVAENCSAGSCTYGFTCDGTSHAGITLNNCAAIDSVTADYSSTLTTYATITYSASEDDSLDGIGSNNLTGIVPGDEFINATPPSDVGSVAQIDKDYLRLKNNAVGDLADSGTTPSYATIDLAGLAIPYSGNYPMGCHVSEMSRKNRIMGPF